MRKRMVRSNARNELRANTQAVAKTPIIVATTNARDRNTKKNCKPTATMMAIPPRIGSSI